MWILPKMMQILLVDTFQGDAKTVLCTELDILEFGIEVILGEFDLLVLGMEVSFGKLSQSLDF